VSGEQVRLIPGADPYALIAQAQERWQPIRTFCLFSGGNDSGVLAHRCREHYDALFFVDTGTAVPGVEDFVREYASWVDKPLVIKRSGDAYRQMVLGDARWWERYREEGEGLTHEQFQAQDKQAHGQKEGRVRKAGYELGSYPWGFPGIGGHRKAYSRLKERRIEELVAETKAGHSRSATVLFISGIRRAESRQRNAYEPLTERYAAKLCNPLIDWTAPEMRRYRKENDVPESEVAALLHRSGECNCAAKGSWWKERGLIKSLWPEWFAETIECLEEEAEDLGIRWCRWGGFDLDGNRAGEVSEELGPLCTDCVPQLELAT
jgi:3'-phosphoadenosine 5'-phosphosulfate sulfotransferase (PAPS reductase)/FAD synthetase